MSAPSLALRVLAPSALVAGALVVWQAAVVGGHISRVILPAPTEILAAFSESGALIFSNLGVTALEAVIGFVIGNLAGYALAVLFVHFEWGRRAVYPLATAAQAVPIVAVTPALLLWFGAGLAPKACVAAFLSFTPMLINAMRGLRSADAEVNELLFTLSASPWQKFVIVRLPASARFAFSALKISACSAAVAALVAEWVAADSGLGYLVVYWSRQYKTAELWAAVLAGAALSLAMYGATVWAERRLTPWNVEGAGS